VKAQDWLNNTMADMSRKQPKAAAPSKPLPRIVGITGVAGSGKDTAAGYLERQHHYHVFRFADPLKRAIESMFGLPSSIWDDRVAKEADIPWLGKSPRYLAQTLGTDWGRKLVSEDLWLLLLQRRLETHKDWRIVVPDVRFDNEAKLIKDAGGVVLHISRDVADAVAPHVSEAGVDPMHVDWWIDNNDSVLYLHADVMGGLELLAAGGEQKP
jgi:hypothetical protein